MQKTKLIQYLSSFSKQDLRLFKDFVYSPFFNKHKKTRALLDYLLKVKSWDSPRLQKELVFDHLYPKQVYNEQLLRTLISYLLQLIYRFYIQKQPSSKAFEQQISLLETSLQHDQKKIFEHGVNHWEKKIAKSEIRDSHYFLQNARYHRLLDTFDLKYGKRISGDFLGQALAHFDTYYIGERLRMTCEMLARKQVTGQVYSFSFIEEMILFLEKEKHYFESIPSVWVYYLIYKMMTENQADFFFQLKKCLQKEASFFQAQEGRDLYTHALNFCIGKINFGETSFKKETFELYQQMLQQELLYIDTVLPQWDYTNIVSLGCDLQEKEWTRKFIVDQKEYLPLTERENTYTYNLAAFHYAQQKYEEAIALLQKVEFTEVYYNLLTRILLLKIYFETKDWAALDYFLETFRIFLIRHKQIEASRRKSGLNLIKYTRALFRLIDKKTIINKNEFKEKMLLLKKQMENQEKLMNRSWLLSKWQAFI